MRRIGRESRHGANGVPQSPPYPKLAGNALKRVEVDAGGRIYLTGSGGAQVWTSPDAFQPWPADQSGGGEGVLLSLKPDLQEVGFASCLFSDTEPGFSPQGLAVTDKAVVVAGRGAFAGALAERAKRAGWSSEDEAAGCMLFVVKK